MDKTDKFEWSVGEQEIYPIDYTQEELREANNNKISKIGHANIRKRVVMQKWQENFGKEISYMNADACICGCGRERNGADTAAYPFNHKA